MKWIGVSIYNPDIDPTFKKAATKKEILEWLDGLGYEPEILNEFEQEDGISFQVRGCDYSTAWIIKL